VARPKLDIDEKKVKKLAERQWTGVEIAAFFGVDNKTISRRFGKEIAISKEAGRAKLRDLQWRSAGKGNVKMQIWLGKQYLGQKDFSKEVIDQKIEIKVEYVKSKGKRKPI
jgi:hypothetical protein